MFYGVMLGILILEMSIQKELKKTDKRITEKLDYDGIEFPVQEKDFSKIEVKSNISINVFGYDDKLAFQYMFQIKNLKALWICCF